MFPRDVEEELIVVSEVDDSLGGRGDSSFTGCFKENVVNVPPLLPYGCDDDSSFIGCCCCLSMMNKGDLISLAIGESSLVVVVEMIAVLLVRRVGDKCGSFVMAESAVSRLDQERFTGEAQAELVVALSTSSVLLSNSERDEGEFSKGEC